MQSVIDPCEIIKQAIIEYTDKHISPDMIIVDRDTDHDTYNMKCFCIGFKGFTNCFRIRVSNIHDEESFRMTAWSVAFKMNKPDFKLK